MNLPGNDETHIKRWTSCLIIKLKIGPSWLGPSFESWAELARADFYVGRVGMGRVGFGPSCPAPGRNSCVFFHFQKPKTDW